MSDPLRQKGSAWGTWLLWAGVAGFAVASGTVLWPAARAEVMVMRTRWQIDQWITGAAPYPGLVAWGNARTTLADALAIHPTDPHLHEAMAYLYASRAQLSAEVPELMRSLYQQALESYQHSLAMRPMSGMTWANVALVHHLLSKDQPAPADLWPAFDKAMAYAQREPAAQHILADIGATRWAELSPDQKAALQTMLQEHVAEHAQADIQSVLQALDRADLIPQEWPVAKSHLMPEWGTETEYWPPNIFKEPEDLFQATRDKRARIDAIINGPDSQKPATDGKADVKVQRHQRELLRFSDEAPTVPLRQD